MNSTPQSSPRSVTTAVAVLVTVFALCGVALLAVHVSLANPMLPRALRDLPRLIGVCVITWFLLRGAPWARWAALAVSLAVAAVLLLGFLWSFQPPSPGMSFGLFLYYISRPAIALGYSLVAATLLLYRPVVAHFSQTPEITNDRNA